MRETMGKTLRYAISILILILISTLDLDPKTPCLEPKPCHVMSAANSKKALVWKRLTFKRTFILPIISTSREVLVNDHWVGAGKQCSHYTDSVVTAKITAQVRTWISFWINSQNPRHWQYEGNYSRCWNRMSFGSYCYVKSRLQREGNTKYQCVMKWENGSLSNVSRLLINLRCSKRRG